MSDDDKNANTTISYNNLINLTPTNSSIDTINELEILANNDSAAEDFVFSRANIRTIIENGKNVIEQLENLATQSNNPRAFEVYATLMNTILAANKDLMQLHKNYKEIAKPEETTNKDNITNNLFVGSSKELQELLDKMNK